MKEDLRSQFVTSKSDQKGLRYAPYAFMEQGVAMLSAVLRSEKAIKVSIEIMNAFVQMRHYLHRSIGIASRLQARLRLRPGLQGLQSGVQDREHNADVVHQGLRELGRHARSFAQVLILRLFGRPLAHAGYKKSSPWHFLFIL